MNHIQQLSRRWREPRVIALAALLLGVVLTTFATRWQMRDNTQSAQLRFETIAREFAGRIAERLHTYEYGLLGARGVVLESGPESDNRERFERYARSRDIDREFPGARGTGVIWRVKQADEMAFTAAVQRDGSPNFEVRQLAPHTGDRYVVTYVEPLGRNLQTLGLDIASDPNRRAAAEESMRSGQARLSAPIKAGPEVLAPQRSFVLLLPVYRPGSPVATAEQREAAALGWTFAPLLIDQVLADLALQDQRFSLSLRDQADAAEAFYSTPLADEPLANAVTQNVTQHVSIPLYGRQWAASFKARPAFLKELNQTDPRLVAATGGLLSLLLAALAYALAQSARAARLVRDEQARRAAIIDGSSDAIIGESLNGLVTDWNGGAERLFGYSAAQTLGKPLVNLLLPEGREEEDAAIRAALTRGESIKAFDTVRRHADGSLIDVSVAASPIFGTDGRCIGIAKTLRDTGAARRSERAIRELNASLERRVAERTEALDTARHDLQAILDAMPSAIAYWDSQLINRVANRAHADWFGKSPQAIIGRHLSELLGPAMFELSRPHAEAALLGKPQIFERSIPLPGDRGIRHAMVYYLPDVIDGTVRGFYALQHDVSELTASRQQLDVALRENEALLSTIRTQAIFSVADRQGRIIEANDNFCQITGYSRNELLGQNHRIVNSGLQEHAFWVDMWQTIASGKPWRGEICNRAKDGSLYWVDSIIAPFMGQDGQVEKYISVRTDVTSAKTAEQKLRASEAFLDRVGETAGVGGWQLELDPIRLTWSTQTYRIHDLEPGTPLQIDGAINFFPGEASNTIRVAVEQCIADGTGYDLELPFVTAAGRHLWVRTVGSAEMQHGKTVRLIGAIQDITSRKKAESLLVQVHDRFAIAADSADIGVWEWDPIADTLSWDARMYRLYAREASGGLEPYRVWSDSLHPDDRDATTAALEAALRGESAYAPEFRIVWPGGEVRHLKASAEIARDKAGKAIRVTGVNIDITERKRAELELRATSSLLHTVLESASEVAIIAGDPQLNITVFNKGAERLLGYSAEELVGHTTPAILHDPEEVMQRAQALGERIGRDVAPTEVFTEPSTLGQPLEWTYVRKDGRRVQVSLVVTAMLAADGTLLGYLGIAHDVTRQKQHEQSLREAMHKAKHASLAKSQFLANMSHEIRTPMNAVIGLTYLLNQTALDAEQADFLAKIRVASKSLLVVINDVLDLSKIEAGELTLEHAPFALRSVLHELGDMMSVQAEAKRIRFTIDAGRDLPPALMGDAVRLHQVLTNLVANAIKFTDRGGVTLEVKRLDAAPESQQVRLRFTVKDSGIGIPPEIREKLFSPFSQADNSTTRRFGGTGLGLSIVKRVITLMGGEVGLASEQGVGSEFWVDVGFDPCDPTKIATPLLADSGPPGRHLAGLRILIADDSEINLEVAKRILSLEGAEVSLANNGQEAVDMLATDKLSFDVVLMDVQMPVLDGHEATRRIRADLGLAKLPVIALTAGALTSEHQKAGAAGMDDFVSKPFDARGLVRTILRHVKPSALMAPEPVAADPAPAPSADDWPQIQGIDADDVRKRLGFDVDLFRSMLQRLLREFADIDDTVSVGDARAREVLAARMHKLKGSASMLGAGPLFRLADHAEAACLIGDSRGAKQWCRKISSQIVQLTQRSEASLKRIDDIHTQRLTATSTTPLNRDRLGDLVTLLNQHSMNALERFHELAPQLRQELGDDAYMRLRSEIENLQFEQAAQMLTSGAF